tara:strand:- start:11 stop:466 length:456 start_codon:yes stop_codon:yes gene_type:complete
MKTYHITAADLDEDGYYVGPLDLTEIVQGSINIAPDLGTVRFRRSLRVTGSILAGSGSGISAGEGISAGRGIVAGRNITAGWGISAGEGIKSGWGIVAGLAITAATISSGLRVFAGTATWKLPEPHEMEVRARLLSGEVAFGTLIEPESVQ